MRPKSEGIGACLLLFLIFGRPGHQMQSEAVDVNSNVVTKAIISLASEIRGA